MTHKTEIASLLEALEENLEEKKKLEAQVREGIVKREALGHRITNAIASNPELFAELAGRTIDLGSHTVHINPKDATPKIHTKPETLSITEVERLASDAPTLWRVGDEIRCIRSSSGLALTEGKIYTVEEDQWEGTVSMVGVYNDDGRFQGYQSTRFTLANRWIEKASDEKLWRAGDAIVCLNPGRGIALTKAGRYTVEEDQENPTTVLIHNDNGRIDRYRADRFAIDSQASALATKNQPIA